MPDPEGRRWRGRHLNLKVMEYHLSKDMTLRNETTAMSKPISLKLHISPSRLRATCKLALQLLETWGGGHKIILPSDS